jgi:aminotransferase
MEQHISTRVASVPPSGIRKYFDIAAEMDNVISLGIGVPDFATPAPITAAGIASLQRGETRYTSNSGTVELRRALSSHLDALYSVRYDAEREMLITVGVSEGIYLAVTAICNPGDEFIIPEPCFVPYEAEVIMAGGVPVYVPTTVDNDFEVTAETIARYVTPRTKGIILSYPNNPTGAVLTRQMMAQIGALAERHDLVIISDEIYDQLIYGVDHTCVPALPGLRERTILLGGFSKDYAMTGWRIGYACANPALIAAMRKIHQYTIMSAPTTGQVAAVTALAEGAPHVEAMRQEYDRRRRLIVDGFNGMGLDCFEPRGAFYAFPSIQRTGLSGAQFAERLLREEHVAVIPGDVFGPSGAGYIRACYATSYEEIGEALQRIAAFVGRHTR